MKITILVALLCGSLFSADKSEAEKLSDPEVRSVRELQLSVSEARADMATALAAYYEKEKAFKNASESAAKAIEQIQNAKCSGCVIDFKTMTWQKPAEKR